MDFFVTVGKERLGPMSETQVRERILSGEFTQHMLCWTEGWTDRRRLVDTFPDAFNLRAHQRPQARPPLKPSHKSTRRRLGRRRPVELNTSPALRRIAFAAIGASALLLAAGWLLSR